MPLYDFECKACRHTFEELAFDDDDVVRCPKCGGLMVEKGRKLVCMDPDCGCVTDREDKEE